MQKLTVDFSQLLIHHYSHRDIRKKVPGLPKGETCCFQMCHALNKAGARVRPLSHGVDYIVQGENHYSRVSGLREYLNERYEPGEIINRGRHVARIAVIAQIIDRVGILAFGNRHIDLWNRTQIQRPTDYIASAIWEAPSVFTVGYTFWEVSPP